MQSPKKKLIWLKYSKKIDSVVDNLGKPIDKGIRETVIALNALRINTTASCEGHANWAYAAPYIDIESLQIYTLKEKRDKIIKTDDPEKIKEINKIICKANLKESKKLLPYLEKFYKTRTPKFDERLIIHTWGLDYGRLQSQGLAFQEINSKKLREQNMKRYQKEMRDFTNFLKLQIKI
jgi:hypothetical protein